MVGDYSYGDSEIKSFIAVEENLQEVDESNDL